MEMKAQATKLQAAENDLKRLMADVTRATEKAEEAVARIASEFRNHHGPALAKSRGDRSDHGLTAASEPRDALPHAGDGSGIVPVIFGRYPGVIPHPENFIRRRATGVVGSHR
jgi:hypothetical protein